MNKTYKYTIASGASREVTFDTGVASLAISNANGEDGATKIEKLKDVELTDLADNQILVYDSTSEKWQNEDQYDTIDDLEDVDITDATDGQILVYDATNEKWVNSDEYEYTLPVATSNTLGGVKIGEGVIIDDGVVSVDESIILSSNGVNYYTTKSIKTGAKWTDGNDIYKKTFEIQSLPSSGTAAIPHGETIESICHIQFLLIDGNTPANYYASNPHITVSANNTNILFTVDDDYSTFSAKVTLFFTIPKAFDRVLFTTDYSSTTDMSSNYQFNGNNGYWNRVWVNDLADEVYIGMTVGAYSGVYNAYVLTKKSGIVCHNRYRRNVGSQSGISDLTIGTAYSDKGYYAQVSPSGENLGFNGNTVGIKKIFNNVSEMLSAFFD